MDTRVCWRELKQSPGWEFLGKLPGGSDESWDISKSYIEVEGKTCQEKQIGCIKACKYKEQANDSFECKLCV